MQRLRKPKIRIYQMVTSLKGHRSTLSNKQNRLRKIICKRPENGECKTIQTRNQTVRFMNKTMNKYDIQQHCVCRETNVAVFQFG